MAQADARIGARTLPQWHFVHHQVRIQWCARIFLTLRSNVFRSAVSNRIKFLIISQEDLV